VFTVTLDRAATDRVSVGIVSKPGSASVGRDYAPIGKRRLVFQPGEIRQTVGVRVRGDRLDEPDETFIVRLVAPSNAVLGRAAGTGTIVDDDEPGGRKRPREGGRVR
jgi:hypothetical protein